MCNQRKDERCLHIAAFGGETGAGSMEGRGLFAGVTVAGVHAEITGLQEGFDGARGSIGFQEQLYYKLKNLGKKQKYVGLSIPSLGIFADRFMYDHANRNDNQTNFKDREQFEKEALDKNLDVGPYPAWASREHNPDKNVKMWMGRGGGIFNFLYGWFIIPSVEGVFDKNTGNTDYAYGPSYNYGNNFLTHIFLDYLPWKMMDVWFPNP